jgi:intermediate cleaving peptidase 55
LYIPDEPKYGEFRGIAVRIEDDVVVGGPNTHHSPTILGVEAPKEVEDIESIMAGVVPVAKH